MDTLVSKESTAFPRTVGRYTLCGEVAAGGMATVHVGRLAGAAGFGRTVAIKRMHAHLAKDAEFVSMFIDEARVAARIHHPNVAATLDVVARDDELFVILEYVHGESLATLLRKATWNGRAMPLATALRVTVDVLYGLHAAHEAKTEQGAPLGIVHRDVSPQNVLIGTDGLARVIDFGVAKATGRLQSTGEGQIKGKIAYMSPEQLRGESIDRRSDVYAASVMLWELLTGKRLFEQTNQGALMLSVLEGEVLPPSAMAVGLPKAFDEIVLRGLSRDPEQRFPTAQEMASRLEAIGPLATPRAVGSWVTETAADALRARAAKIAQMESASDQGLAPPAESPALQIAQPGPAAAEPAPEPAPAAPSAPRPVEPPLPSVEISLSTMSHLAAGATASPASAALEPPASGTARGAPRGPWLLVGLAGACALAGGAGLAALRMRAASPTSTSAVTLSASGAVVAPPRPSASAIPMVPSAVAPLPAACPDGMNLIPGGETVLGSRDLEAAALSMPTHDVSLASFCLDRTEVTTKAYDACVVKGACERPLDRVSWPNITDEDKKIYSPFCNESHPDRLDHPINCVAWSMARKYCEKRGARLPTEAEWEFAARGPQQRRYPWGDTAPSAKYLNACGAECARWSNADGRTSMSTMYAGNDGFVGTSPVGSFPLGASANGILDLAGNVWEWTADWFAPYGAEGATNPKGPATGTERVVRGGDFLGSNADWARPAWRFKTNPDTYNHAIGFRCAADAK